MKILVACILAVVFLFSATAQAQQKTKVEEPQYIFVFHYLDSAGKLLPLEKQTPKITSKISMLGYGGASSGYEFTGGTSSVRFKSGDPIEIIVRGMSADIDPSDMIAIVALKSKKDKRSITLTKIGTMGMSTKTKDAFEQSFSFTTSKYGDGSLKIKPDKLAPGEYAVVSKISQYYFLFGIDSVK
ncbi:MAG TPA: hypothetical protein PKY59_14385 [Pyrinomonadaceae bacterium]|nr:hypothetical protein [Pyrinomonadaceae bacterium]